MLRNNEYAVFVEGNFSLKKLRQVINYARQDELYSARLSSGIFGSAHCATGNRGPRSASEVVFAVGDEGLVKIVQLGFLPCPVCKLHKEPYFWKKAHAVVQEKYQKEGVSSVEDFEKLPFDARRVEWEVLVPLVGVPNRLYLPKGGIWLDDLLVLKERFERLDAQLPPAGYYDKNVPDKFVEYVMRSL